jgi:hypothetical protein
MSVSHDGQYLATISVDRSVKVFDVVGFDLINMFSVSFAPSCISFVYSSSGLFSVFQLVLFWIRLLLDELLLFPSHQYTPLSYFLIVSQPHSPHGWLLHLMKTVLWRYSMPKEMEHKITSSLSTLLLFFVSK